MRRPVLTAATLCLLVAVSYFPATGAGFVWDDVVLTMARPLHDWAGLRQIWFEPRSLTDFEGHYWPLLYTTFWLEHKLWGLNPLGYHLVNMVLHAAVVLLLWRLLLRMGVAGATGAMFAAAVFAVHPVHVESVVWVIGRKDVLAALFYLACVHCYLRFMEDGRRGFYAGALALFVTGLLCKSILITLPVVLLLWHWWRRGRVTSADLRRVLPFLLLGFVITLADVSFYKARDPTAFDYSLIERALVAARALGFYFGKLVWPTELAVIYPRWEVGAGDYLAWGCALGAAAVLALLWFHRHRIGRGPLAGALFFAVTLSPTLGFVEYGYMQFSFVADRYQYLAGAGITVTLIAAAARAAGRLSDAPRKAVQGMAVLLLVALGTVTWNQAGIYRDNRTFYSHIIALNPQARNAYYNLGGAHLAQGRLDDALAAYRIAGQQRPGHVYAHVGAATAATDLGRIDEAETHIQRAFAIDSRVPQALDTLGAMRLRQQRYPEALAAFQTLREMEPERAKVYSGIGVALEGLNRFDEALRSFERALELDPSLEEARINRAHLLKKLQNETQ